jgi:histidinol phosphatase-like enzyme
MEPPAEDEGFASIERMAFERAIEPDHAGRGLFVQIEGVLRASKSGARAPLDRDDLVVQRERGARLADHRARGFFLAGFSWQPAIAEGEATEAEVRACFDATARELDVDIDILFCPHGGGPPRCWCRPPLPGLILWHLERHRLDPSRCMLVGASSADRTVAGALGMPFVEGETFFAP